MKSNQTTALTTANIPVSFIYSFCKLNESVARAMAAMDLTIIRYEQVVKETNQEADAEGSTNYGIIMIVQETIWQLHDDFNAAYQESRKLPDSQSASKPQTTANIFDSFHDSFCKLEESVMRANAALELIMMKYEYFLKEFVEETEDQGAITNGIVMIGKDANSKLRDAFKKLDAEYLKLAYPELASKSLESDAA